MIKNNLYKKLYDQGYLDSYSYDKLLDELHDMQLPKYKEAREDLKKKLRNVS